MRSRIEPMKKIARTLRIHRELLLNYFKAKKQFSSGVVEGLNNTAKVTMRRSYGFRTFRVRELALYHSFGKLPEPKHGAYFGVQLGWIWLQSTCRVMQGQNECDGRLNPLTIALTRGMCRYY
jgi:hypothetical protein